MKRKLLSLLLILAFTAGLSGCAARHEENSADSETTEQSTESVDEQTTEQTAAHTTEQTAEQTSGQTTGQTGMQLSNNKNVSGRNFTGEWHRTDVIKACSATIKISNQKDNSFHFSFEGYFAANVGTLEGDAAIASSNEATCTVSDGTESGCSAVIRFRFSKTSLSVTVDGDIYALEFGASVTMDGTYTKSNPVYTNANIVNRIFPTDALKNRMKKLLGDTAYTEMVDIMEYGIGDQMPDYTYSGVIFGIGEGVDLKISKNKIYCLLDSEGCTFYTNDSLYKDKLPDFMSDSYIVKEPLHFVYKEV